MTSASEILTWDDYPRDGDAGVLPLSANAAVIEPRSVHKSTAGACITVSVLRYLCSTQPGASAKQNQNKMHRTSYTRDVNSAGHMFIAYCSSMQNYHGPDDSWLSCSYTRACMRACTWLLIVIIKYRQFYTLCTPATWRGPYV
eukprot:scaffold55123_cov20-Tisochrysis_lutea.AAC.2